MLYKSLDNYLFSNFNGLFDKLQTLCQLSRQQLLCQCCLLYRCTGKAYQLGKGSTDLLLFVFLASTVSGLHGERVSSDRAFVVAVGATDGRCSISG